MTAAVEETGLGQAAGKAATLVRDSVKTVIAASMVGTAIEFYDFYAYGTAAANYFPHIFFSAKDNPTVALLMSLLTFAVAFIARPLGSLIFGHFGDLMGRKAPTSCSNPSTIRTRCWPGAGVCRSCCPPSW